MVTSAPSLRSLRCLGLRLEVGPDRRPQVRGPTNVLRGPTFTALLPYRPRLIAEWCLSTRPPPDLEWDSTLAEGVAGLVTDVWAELDPGGIALEYAYAHRRTQCLRAWYSAQGQFRAAEEGHDLILLAAAGRRAILAYAALAPPRVRRPDAAGAVAGSIR